MHAVYVAEGDTYVGTGKLERYLVEKLHSKLKKHDELKLTLINVS